MIRSIRSFIICWLAKKDKTVLDARVCVFKILALDFTDNAWRFDLQIHHVDEPTDVAGDGEQSRTKEALQSPAWKRVSTIPRVSRRSCQIRIGRGTDILGGKKRAIFPEPAAIHREMWLEMATVGGGRVNTWGV